METCLCFDVYLVPGTNLSRNIPQVSRVGPFFVCVSLFYDNMNILLIVV